MANYLGLGFRVLVLGFQVLGFSGLGVRPEGWDSEDTGHLLTRRCPYIGAVDR